MKVLLLIIMTVKTMMWTTMMWMVAMMKRVMVEKKNQSAGGRHENLNKTVDTIFPPSNRTLLCRIHSSNKERMLLTHIAR